MSVDDDQMDCIVLGRFYRQVQFHSKSIILQYTGRIVCRYVLHWTQKIERLYCFIHHEENGCVVDVAACSAAD